MQKRSYRKVIKIQSCRSGHDETVIKNVRYVEEGTSNIQLSCTANEGQVRIQYKCLVLIYVLPEIKLFFPKQNYNVLSPSPYTHISVRDLYISRIGLPILLQGNMWTDPGNIYCKSLTDT